MWEAIALFVVLALGIMCGLGCLGVVAVVICTDDRQAQYEHDKSPPTLVKYWQHEHPLLALLWTKPIYPHKDYYLNRPRRSLILLGVFLVNFLVVGIIAIQVPPYPNCEDTQAAYEACLDDGADCNNIEVKNCDKNCRIMAGFNTALRQYEYPNTGSKLYKKYFKLARENDKEINTEKPCFTYCHINDTTEDVESDYVFRRFYDNREDCSDVTGNKRLSMACYVPYFQGDSTTICDAGVFFSLSPVEFAARLFAVTVIVLPMSFLLKKLFRCTALSTGCVGCCKRLVGYPVITALLVACVILSIVMAVSLQGRVIGDFTNLFLISFMLGQVAEFPKLAVLYYAYKKKKLEAQWEALQDEDFDYIGMDGYAVKHTHDGDAVVAQPADAPKKAKSKHKDKSKHKSVDPGAPLSPSPHADAPISGKSKSKKSRGSHLVPDEAYPGQRTSLDVAHSGRSRSRSRSPGRSERSRSRSPQPPMTLGHDEAADVPLREAPRI